MTFNFVGDQRPIDEHLVQYVVQLRLWALYMGANHKWLSDVKHALKFDTIAEALLAADAYDVVIVPITEVKA